MHKFCNLQGSNSNATVGLFWMSQNFCLNGRENSTYEKEIKDFPITNNK